MPQKWRSLLCETLKMYSKLVPLASIVSLSCWQSVGQCSIPVFSALLPDPHNTQVLHLLFTLCHWHGLAKLRLYTDETLHILEMVTKDLGDSVRSFALTTCLSFATKELPRKATAWLRWQMQQNQARSTVSHSIPTSTQAQQPRVLNLQTYKLHSLADYPVQIRIYSTMDSYSTQAVCVLP